MYKNRLKNLRLNKKLLQRDIANILDISEITYTHYESEYYIMPLKYLVQLCNYYKVSLDYMFEFSDNKNISVCNNNIDKNIIGKRLKEFRKEKNITQNKLSIILNTSQSNISEYERGTNIIATPFLYDICKKYHVSADYLLGRTDEPKYLK